MEIGKPQADFNKKDIKKSLMGFTKLNKKNITNELDLGMQIKYVTNRDGQILFRNGGILVKIDDKGRYIMLKSMINQTIRPWSVQLDSSEIFYKDIKENQREIKELTDQMGGYKLLKGAVRVLGSSKDIVNENIKIIKDNYNGDVENMFRYIDKLENKIQKLSNKK